MQIWPVTRPRSLPLRNHLLVKSPAPAHTKRPRPPKFRLAAVLLRALGKTSGCYRAWCSRLLRCWPVLKALGGAPKPQHRLAL
jgi:hypothetical protein